MCSTVQLFVELVRKGEQSSDKSGLLDLNQQKSLAQNASTPHPRSAAANNMSVHHSGLCRFQTAACTQDKDSLDTLWNISLYHKFFSDWDPNLFKWKCSSPIQQQYTHSKEIKSGNPLELSLIRNEFPREGNSAPLYLWKCFLLIKCVY